MHYTATASDRLVFTTCFKDFLNIKQNKPFSSCLHLLFLLFTTGAPNEGGQTARRISVSKTTAPGKGLKVMCLEGEAYMHAYAYSLCSHHWYMRRSQGCVQYVYIVCACAYIHSIVHIYIHHSNVCMHMYTYVVPYGRKYWWSKYGNFASKKEK